MHAIYLIVFLLEVCFLVPQRIGKIIIRCHHYQFNYIFKEGVGPPHLLVDIRLCHRTWSHLNL